MEENKEMTKTVEDAPATEYPQHVPEEKKFSWKDFWDKVTTGLLILLLASPILVLAYIVISFITR